MDSDNDDALVYGLHVLGKFLISWIVIGAVLHWVTSVTERRG